MATELDFVHTASNTSAPFAQRVEAPQGANPLTNLAYGVAHGAAGAAIQGGVNYLLAEHSFKRQKQLMREQFRLNEKAQKDLMRNMKESYEAAGLNPALLHEGGYSAPQVSGASAPSPSVGSPNIPVNAKSQGDLLGGALAEQASDVSLKQAQAANIAAETEGIKLQNENMQAANDSVDLSIRPLLQQIATQARENGDDETADRIESNLNDPNFTYNVGSIEGVKEFNDMLLQNSEVNRKQIADEIESKLNVMMMQSEDVMAAKAALPVAQFEQVQSHIKQMNAHAAELMSQVGLNGVLAQKLGVEIQGQLEAIESEILSNKHKLWNKGRYGDFGLSVVGDLWSALGNIASFGVAGMAIKGVSKAAGAVKASKAASEGAFKSLPPKELSGFPLSRRKEMASIELRSWHRSHPNVPIGSSKFNEVKEDIAAKYGVFHNPVNKLR